MSHTVQKAVIGESAALCADVVDSILTVYWTGVEASATVFQCFRAFQVYNPPYEYLLFSHQDYKEK